MRMTQVQPPGFLRRPPNSHHTQVQSGLPLPTLLVHPCMTGQPTPCSCDVFSCTGATSRSEAVRRCAQPGEPSTPEGEVPCVGAVGTVRASSHPRAFVFLKVHGQTLQHRAHQGHCCRTRFLEWGSLGKRETSPALFYHLLLECLVGACNLDTVYYSLGHLHWGCGAWCLPGSQ